MVIEFLVWSLSLLALSMLLIVLETLTEVLLGFIPKVQPHTENNVRLIINDSMILATISC